MDLKIDFSTVTGAIKPMNAVNNGPAFTENEDQNGTNLPDFKYIFFSSAILQIICIIVFVFVHFKKKNK